MKDPFAELAAAWAEVRRREAIEDAAKGLLDRARKEHLAALTNLALAFNECERNKRKKG